MKKVIAIISCIMIISALLIVSTFAYDRIDDIPFETLELSEKEERTEENNVLRSVSTIEINKKYLYNSADVVTTTFYNGDSNTSGHYKGKAYKQSESYSDYDLDFVKIWADNNRINLRDSDNNIYFIYNYENQNYNGEIIFYSAISSNYIRNFFEETLTYAPMNDVYDNSSDFLGFITQSIDNLVTYMITNNLILIVIGIVIVSFAVGLLVRINRNKF